MYSELPGRLLDSATGKNIDLVLAVRANKVAHVFYKARNIDLHLAKHLDSFAGVLQRNVRWRGNDNRGSQRDSLDERQSHIASPRWEVDDQVIQCSPLDRSQKLP